ncbi:MAG: hypothetical protein MN733_04315 [Nitrososphaera sp.]|nr:hypothetical protein [Nitrososphaera sp.]
MPRTHTVKFIKEADTKNMVRFVEVPDEGKEAIIRNIYIRKDIVNGAKAVVLEVNFAD